MTVFRLQVTILVLAIAFAPVAPAAPASVPAAVAEARAIGLHNRESIEFFKTFLNTKASVLSAEEYESLYHWRTVELADISGNNKLKTLRSLFDPAEVSLKVLSQIQSEHPILYRFIRDRSPRFRRNLDQRLEGQYGDALIQLMVLDVIAIVRFAVNGHRYAAEGAIHELERSSFILSSAMKHARFAGSAKRSLMNKILMAGIKAAYDQVGQRTMDTLLADEVVRKCLTDLQNPDLYKDWYRSNTRYNVTDWPLIVAMSSAAVGLVGSMASPYFLNGLPLNSALAYILMIVGASLGSGVVGSFAGLALEGITSNPTTKNTAPLNEAAKACERSLIDSPRDQQ